MSLSPILAVRKALRARINATPEFRSFLNGGTIFDEAPRDIEPPYGYFGETQMRDWSADDVAGAEQYLNLSIVTLHRGVSATVEIGQLIIEQLNHAQLPLDDNLLVDFSFISMETRREQNGRLSKVNIRFRATTEYLVQ